MTGTERWQDIDGFEGLYQASNLGRIRSLDRKHYIYNYKKNEMVARKIKGRILKYGSITQLEAINKYWDWRLSDKIYRLKKQGYNIRSENIKVKRADNTDAYVAKYTLEEMEMANENHIPSLY